MSEFVTVSPSVFAQLKGLSPGEFCHACQQGQDTFGDFPIGKWVRRNGGSGQVSHLRVPRLIMERHIENGKIEVENIAQEVAQSGQTGPWEALQNVAVPVSGQITAGTVLHRYASVIEQHPGLVVEVFDVVAGLGTGALTYAALGEDHSPGWVIAGALAGFFGMRGGRALMDSTTRSPRLLRAQQKRPTPQEIFPSAPGSEQRPSSMGDGEPTLNKTAFSTP
jgi:hypothetical protein